MQVPLLAAELVHSKYAQIYSLNNLSPHLIGAELPLPRFSRNILYELVAASKARMMNEKNVIQVPKDVFVVGDLHGSIIDLLRILNVTQGPTNKHILFLGDYVDRGDFSLEVITLLLSLYLLYPEKIFLIRGNHEFRTVNIKYGFLKQIQDEYESCYLWEEFNDMFAYMPIAAVIGATENESPIAQTKLTFCVHGGISRNFDLISDLDSIERPIHTFDNKVICDIMWSDPSDKTSLTLDNPRGKGCLYGVMALKNFLDKNNACRMLRAHQCVMTGVEMVIKNSLYTIFSASCYCDNQMNAAGIAFIDQDGELKAFTLEPIRQLKKEFSNSYLVEKAPGNGSSFAPVHVPRHHLTLCKSLRRRSKDHTIKNQFSSRRPFSHSQLAKKSSSLGSILVI